MSDHQTEIRDTSQDQAEPSLELDPLKFQAFQTQLEDDQNLFMGILAGVFAGIIGAAIWAGITILTKYQIGWMAVGIGLLVGFAVRAFGRGISTSFGVVGGVCALFGCLLGNLLTVCWFSAVHENVAFMEILGIVITAPSIIVGVMKDTFNTMDLLFYGLAVYEGYKLSFRKVSAEDIQRLQ